MELDRQIHHFERFQANAMSGLFLTLNRLSVLSFPSMAQELIVGRRRRSSFSICLKRKRMTAKRYETMTGAMRAEDRVNLEDR